MDIMLGFRRTTHGIDVGAANNWYLPESISNNTKQHPSQMTELFSRLRTLFVLVSEHKYHRTDERLQPPTIPVSVQLPLSLLGLDPDLIRTVWEYSVIGLVMRLFPTHRYPLQRILYATT